MAKRFAGGRSFNDLPPPPPPPPDQLEGVAAGRATVGGTLTLTPPTGAGVIAGRASGLGAVTGALTLTAPPPPPGSAFYINAATGNNANSGAIGAPWLNYAPITPARVPAGSTLFFARGQRHLPVVLGTDAGVTLGTLNIPQNNITIDAYGTGARPIIYGWQDIKGVAGDWTESATPNNWSRQFTVAIQSRYRFKVDDVIWTIPLLGPTASTTVNAEGEWAIHQIGTGPLFTQSRLYMYSVGNPATVKTTIEISTHFEYWLRGETKTNFTMKNIDITGWKGGVWVSNNGLLIEDVDIYGCARRLFQLWGSGSCVLRRIRAYKTGFAPVPNTPGGTHGIIFTGPDPMDVHAILDGFQVWECGEDGIQLGGTLSQTSTVLLDGRNYRSFIALNRENPLDIKDGNCEARHVQLYSANEGCITMQGQSKIGKYVDCVLTATQNLSPFYIQETQTQALIDHCMAFGMAAGPLYLSWSGSRHKVSSSVLIGHAGSTSGLIWLRQGELDLIHTTISSHNVSSGMPAIYVGHEFFNVSNFTSIVKISGPDGEGNNTYRATVASGGTLRSWGEQSQYEFTGLSGAQAALNNLTLTSFNVPVSTSFLVGDFKIPASLGVPDTIDVTGGSFWGIPRLRTIIGNAFISGDKVMSVDHIKSLPDTSYGVSYLKDTIVSAERHASLKLDNVTSTFYTAAQVKAASGAGSLLNATGGKVGGPANRTDFVATQGLRWVNVSSIVVTGGVAVVNFATPHGFAGDKVCILGAINTGGTPAMLANQTQALVGCNFFRENSTTQIEFDALPWVIDQTATGTITATDGQLIAGSAGLGTHVQTNVAVHGVTTDFHNKAFPAVGAAGNFGAIAP